MSLKNPHVVTSPVVEHAAVGGRVEGDRGASVVQVDDAYFRVVAVHPAHTLQKNLVWRKQCKALRHI